MAVDSPTPEPPEDPKKRLERIKKSFWPAEGREERIARARQAVEGRKISFHLTPAQWKQIAEDPDLSEH
jgi:hypothetical protein